MGWNSTPISLPWTQRTMARLLMWIPSASGMDTAMESQAFRSGSRGSWGEARRAPMVLRFTSSPDFSSNRGVLKVTGTLPTRSTR